MYKKRSPIKDCVIIFFVFVAVGLGYMFINYTVLNPLPNDYYIFNTIEECEGLIPGDQSGIKVERYDTPSGDKDIKNLTYSDFFGMEFKSDELEYEIFAYEFDNSETALEYFNNCTGQKRTLNQGVNKIHSASVGIFGHYDLVLVFENRAYKLNSHKNYANEITDLFGETFSQSIK